MRKHSESIIALIAGATLGLVVGLLFAPAKGDSVRSALTYQLKRYGQKLRALIKELATAKNIASSKAKAAGQGVINDTINKAKQLLKDADELTTQLERGH